MNTLKVKRLVPHASLPTRSHQSAGYDLRAVETVELAPGQVTPVPTGLAIELPPGHAGLFWDRSGMGKKGLTVFGGVVDEDYRGEWVILIHNSTAAPYLVNAGDRVAQFLVQEVKQWPIDDVEELTQTVRGADGFGSTGK